MCELTGNAYTAATAPTAPAVGSRIFYAVSDKHGDVDGLCESFIEAETFRYSWDKTCWHGAPHRVIVLREVA